MTLTETRTTKDIHSENGEYNKERATLHFKIQDKIIGDSIELPELEAILFGGGAGAGKSAIKESHAIIEGYVQIDSDNIKTFFPEYVKEELDRDPTITARVHDESGDIAKSLLEHCIDHGFSFVYDGTMNYKPHYDWLVNELRVSDYIISGIFVDIDVEKAISRTISRQAETGRIVSEDFVRESNESAARTFHSLQKSNVFETILMFNNTEDRLEGEEVPLMYRYEDKKGTKTIPEYYDLYRQKCY